jgi:hypothetical protein
MDLGDQGMRLVILPLETGLFGIKIYWFHCRGIQRVNGNLSSTDLSF